MIRPPLRLSCLIAGAALVSVPALAAAAPRAAAGVRPATQVSVAFPCTPLICLIPPDGGGLPIEVKSFTWGAAQAQPLERLSSDPQEGGEVYSADPEEGGEVYSADPEEGGEIATSDPQEGGEIVRGVEAMKSRNIAKRAKARVKPAMSDITISKHLDKASPRLAEPLATGTITMVVARGACVKGTHFPEVKLAMRDGGRVYTLNDVEVMGCTATAADSDTCTLSYAALGE